MKRLQILITLLLTVGFAIGQTVYPIRTFTVVNAPAPYALSGFASEPGRVQLNILTDDIALDRYAVKFRLTIQGNGLKLFTKPDFHQQPFYLDGGVTQTLTGMDLEALFNPDNLVFEGYSASEYRRNGRLPEGVYRVWVDLLDYYRGMQVSQSLPGMAMIYLTRAPRLSFPLPGTEIDPLVKPNIRFAWMGSLPADPLADVVYQFRLWETRPEGRDPYEVVAVSSPLFTQEVENPNFIYDMGMPPLTDGMTYVWQVRALDREGRALFQNSGLSNASTFRYGRSCPVPVVAITSVTHTSASVKWQGSQAAQLYRISYRPTRDSNWQHAETTSSSYTFNNLADNTPYEVMVQAVCNGQEGDPGRVVGFKTTRQVDYTCGGKGGQFDLSNREPLPSLSRFDEFKAADFIVEVDEVTGQDGRFSGSGFALVPYLGFAKFMVTFNNIFVNADRRMTQGHIQFVVNDTTGMVLGLGTGKGNGNNGTGTTEVDPGTIADEVYTVDGDVTNITVTGNTVTVTNGDGTTQTIVVKDGNTVAVVPSSGGTVYVADQATGSVYTTPKTQAGGGKPGSVGTPSQTGQYNCGIDFKAPKQMRFGHDPVGNGKTKPDAYFRTNASGSRVGWKSLRAGDTDIIDLVPRGGCQADSLRYLRTSGLATPTAPQGKGHRLLLGGLAAGDEDMLTVAVAKTQHVNDTTKREILTEAGALGLVAYDQIRKRVILVKVNGSRMPDVVTAIRDSLNAHYKPAVVEWTVDVKGSAVTVPSITSEGFNTAGSGLFARYTSDMRKVINAFEQQHGAIGKDDLCLFFVDVADQARSGFMPLDGQYGFIFNFNNDPATVAHELAHGAFNLRHTFSSKAQHYLPEKTTHNLLDYANGTELWKYQWDLIHNPETILLGFMQDESEGAKEAMPLLNVAWTKASVPDGLFLSPGGMPIGLTGITELAFLKSAESGIDSRTVLKSVLYGFAKGEQRYFANFNGGRFTGYFLEGTTSEKEVFTDTEGVTKKLVQSGRYDVTLLGIDGEAPTTRQVDNNLWYDQPDWRNYTAQGSQLTIIDDYTFMPCGSLLREYKDSPLMESHVLKTAILKNPCVLKDPATIHFGSYVPESQWMNEFNMVFGVLLNVGVGAPLAAEFIIAPALDVIVPLAIEEGALLLDYFTQERVRNMAGNIALDISMQAWILNAFEGVPLDKLPGAIDYPQAGVAGIEGAVDIPLVSAFVTPLYGALCKDGRLRDDLSFDSFFDDYVKGAAIGTVISVVASDHTKRWGYISRNIKKLQDVYKKLGRAEFIKRLKDQKVYGWLQSFARKSELGDIATQTEDELVSGICDFLENSDDVNVSGNVSTVIRSLDDFVMNASDDVKKAIQAWTDQSGLKSKLDDLIRNANYQGLAQELADNVTLVRYFEAVHTSEQWWVKYSLRRKIIKSSTEIPENFAKMVNDINLPGGNKLGKVDLGDVYEINLGKYFEDEALPIIKQGFEQGSFDGLPLPKGVKDELEKLYAQGYTQMAIQPKLSINGRAPEPDILLFKVDAFGLLDISEPAVYIDCKLHVDTKFTPAQDEIVKNLNRDIVIKSKDETTGILANSTNSVIRVEKVFKLCTDNSTILTIEIAK